MNMDQRELLMLEERQRNALFELANRLVKIGGSMLDILNREDKQDGKDKWFKYLWALEELVRPEDDYDQYM